jgi:predicted permease
MRLIKRLRAFFHLLSSRQGFEDGMSEELRFHIEQYSADLVRSGISPGEASRRARMELGGLNSVKGECRQARGLHMLDEARRELSYAARLLRKAPGFTITALLTLAVCLGANLTIFAVIDSVLLRPLPFPNAGRLVTLFNTYPKAGVERDGSSLTNYYERRGHIPAFSALAIYRFGTAIVGDAGSTERAEIMRVSPDFFATLGRGPVMGRVFTEAETSYQTDGVVILTDTYWRQHFHADPRVIGRQIRVDDLPKTVVGVLPAGFRFLSSQARLYFPLSSDPQQRIPLQRHSGGNVIQMIARLRPGATLAQAQSEIDTQNGTLELDDPQAGMMAAAGFRSLVVPLHADHVEAIRPVLLLLQTGTFVLLLIGVVNLLNLLLIRAHGRAKESALRRALGAGTGHVMSEIVVETTLLTMMGGALGLALAAGGIRLLAHLGADRLPLGSQIAFDARLALVAVLGSLVLGVFLGAPIAWINFRSRLAQGLQSESRGGTASRATQRLRHSFIVAQIALAVVLLAGAGLLSLSLRHVLEVSPGFRADHILTGQISLPRKNYPDNAADLGFTGKLLAEIARQPGVVAAGVVTNVPFSGYSGKSAATVKGHIPRPGESPRGHYWYGVDGDYFGAMGFTLRAGRFLTAADSRRAGRVCVVDEDFARYYWPKGGAVGGLLFQGSNEEADAAAFTVVGVVGAVKQAGLTDEGAQGAVYYPFVFDAANDMFVVARTTLSPAFLGLALRKVVRQIDPELPVNDVRSMETRITDSLVARRSPALLAGLFSAIAMLLTALGTYGVLSYTVAQRRREIGVRMALGAQPKQIHSQFFSLALRLLAGGTILGVAGALLAGRAMQAVLFHVPAFNLPALAGAAGVMAAVSLLACLLPSRRAARISPLEALGDR